MFVESCKYFNVRICKKKKKISLLIKGSFCKSCFSEGRCYGPIYKRKKTLFIFIPPNQIIKLTVEVDKNDN